MDKRTKDYFVEILSADLQGMKLNQTDIENKLHFLEIMYNNSDITDLKEDLVSPDKLKEILKYE